AREAIAFVRNQAPGRRIIVAGLCSGGWHAFCAARDGLRGDAVVAINPPLYFRGGSPEIRWRAPARWANALRRPLSVRPFRPIRRHLTRQSLAKQEVGNPRHTAVRTAVRMGGHLLGAPLFDGLARDLEGIGTRGITSLFVFSGGDRGLEYLQL